MCKKCAMKITKYYGEKLKKTNKWRQYLDEL